MRSRRNSKERARGRTSKDERSGRRTLRRGTERAATMVEYALLMGALVIPTIAAIEYLQAGAEVKIQSTADGISTRTIPSITTTTTGP